MNKFKYLRIVSTFLLITVSVLARPEGNTIHLSQQQIDNLGIKLGKLEPTSHVPLFSAPAKVVVPPAHEFVVSTSQAGLIVKMNAAVGDKVDKGELLALINSPDLLSLQGNYLKAAGALKLAKAAYDRNKKLRVEGVISGRNEQEALSAYNAAAVDMNEAGQLLKIAGMSATEIKHLDNSGKLASQISIRAPFSGRVIERMAATGSRVDNLAPLFRIANLNELWLEINIPQEHVGDLKLGDHVQIENGRVKAVLKVLGQNVNPENQTIPARAFIKSPPASLRVGQKVTVQALKDSQQAAYLLPDSAISHNEGKAYIFIKTRDGFDVSEVFILGKQDSGSVVSGNLTGSEDVAVDNTVALKANWLGLGSNE